MNKVDKEAQSPSGVSQRVLVGILFAILFTMVFISWSRDQLQMNILETMSICNVQVARNHTFDEVVSKFQDESFFSSGEDIVTFSVNTGLLIFRDVDVVLTFDDDTKEAELCYVVTYIVGL